MHPRQSVRTVSHNAQGLRGLLRTATWGNVIDSGALAELSHLFICESSRVRLPTPCGSAVPDVAKLSGTRRVTSSLSSTSGPVEGYTRSPVTVQAGSAGPMSRWPSAEAERRDPANTGAPDNAHSMMG